MSECTPDDLGPDRILEKYLMGIVLLFARILRTAFDFLFRPESFQRVAKLVPNTHSVLKPPVEYAAPLSYLVASATAATVYGHWIVKSPAGSKLLLHSPVFQPFQMVLLFAWEKASGLDFAKVVLLMLPNVAAVVLYSAALRIACYVLKAPNQFITLLGIGSYFMGTYLLLHSVLFSYSLVLVAFQDKVSGQFLAGLLLAVHIPIGILILVALARYLSLLRRHLEMGWQKVGVVVVGATLIFALFFIPAVVLLFPILLKQ